MDVLLGTWTDGYGDTILIEENGSSISVQYENGRGPFKGHVKRVDNNFIVRIDFTDGVNPEAGKQVGVLNFGESTIYWGNNTKWSKKS
jgi:hypothetical protein